MLRWLGHEAVAVLNGGWTAWQAAGGPVTTEITHPLPADFVARPREGWTLTAGEVDRIREDEAYALIDSRAAERYRGEVEPIDPVAGHIPGARNLPFPDNWDEHGLMRPVEELRVRFARLPAPERTVFYCGSGVTACYNILAFAHAGLGMPRLYPGSWSEWIANKERPVAKA
jgi:thiosulfate/3-mercaptopyruvate sulfurtransferase